MNSGVDDTLDKGAVVDNGPGAWLTPKWFALLLLGLIAAFFPDILLGTKSFAFRDSGIFTYPNAYFQHESFWRGEVPLWNPYNNCGIPFLAQWNTAALYPLSLIYLILPLSWGLNLFLLGHLFIAGFGMYLLASRWTQNRLAGAVAGVAFAFNGLTLNCLMQISNLAALAWMPMVVLLVEQAYLIGGKRVIIAALVGANQMLAGAPEIIVFTWLVTFLLWVGAIMFGRIPKSKVTLRLFAVVFLVAALSAVQLLPFLELLAHSDRSTAYGTSIWTIPTWGWANLFVPLFHCYRAPLGVYFQWNQDWTSSYYLGAAMLTLALTAILLVRNPRVWLLAVLAIFGFIVALGDPGVIYPALMKFFPVLGFMRFPIKFAFLTVFSIPLLAAYLIAKINSNQTLGIKSDRNLSRCFVGMVILSMMVITGVLIWSRSHPIAYEEWPVLFQNGVWRAFFLIGIAALVLNIGKITDARLKIIAGILLPILVWSDVATHAPRQNPTADSTVFQPGILTERLHPLPKLGESRAFMTKASHDTLYGSELKDLGQDFLSRRCGLMGDCNLLDGIPVPDGFYSLYVREQRSLFNWFFQSAARDFPTGLADFLGISMISDPDKFLSWQPRLTYLPCCTIGIKPVFVALSNTPSLLLQTNFDPRHIVYLPMEAKPFFQQTNQVGGMVRVKNFTPRLQTYEAQANAPTVMVLSQTYYSAWRAFVDEKPARLWQANFAFQAIEIPTGKHQVTLVYQDHRFLLGSFISLFTLAGSVLVLFRKCVSLLASKSNRDVKVLS